MTKKALILVDLQNDFCPLGNLAIPHGDEVVPVANRLSAYFELIIATQDFHPKDHMSFASNHPGYSPGEVITINNMKQVLWPDHCVQGTKGAEFHPALQTSKIRKIFHKGVEKHIDSYSAFYDNAHLRSTGLAEYLHHHQITDIYLMGLATDYCVKYSALDAKKSGFNVYVVSEGCRGVELKKGDVEKALEEMEAAGVKLVHVEAVISSA